ncbi:MAG: SufD family Fe-S cluster assembly protein [bacterium]
MLSKLKVKNNYFFKVEPIISILLDENFDKKISLKDLLKNRFGEFNFINNFKIKIIIAPNLSFIIEDNLLDLELFSSNLEFVLNKDSNLDYILRTDSLKTCKDFCGDCISCKKVEKIKKELSFKFVGQGSCADIKISLNGAGSYYFDLKTTQDHQASDSKSNLIIKSALSQGAYLKSDNLVRIAKNLQRVEANQINKNLLLGCSSKVICIPKLEVESNDVVCKHGAAVSRIDENQLFYLNSRGIGHCKAREVLIDAFLK